MGRILLIDDEADVREMLRHALEEEGHEVVEAGDGRAALRATERVKVDLVITDLVMPEMDGLEVIVTLGRRNPGLPVVAISGGGLFSKELLLSNADVLGAVSTLAKPFELSDLLEAVRSALATSERAP